MGLSTESLAPASQPAVFFVLLIYFWLCWVRTATRASVSLWQAGPALQWQCTVFSLSVASPVAEHSSRARRLPQLQFPGSTAQARQLWFTGLAALQHVGSTQIRGQTHVSCTGRDASHWVQRSPCCILSQGVNPAAAESHHCPLRKAVSTDSAMTTDDVHTDIPAVLDRIHMLLYLNWIYHIGKKEIWLQTLKSKSLKNWTPTASQG